MTACPIRYQRQVSDRKGKIFYTSITSLSHISKGVRVIAATLSVFRVISIECITLGRSVRIGSDNPAL